MRNDSGEMEENNERFTMFLYALAFSLFFCIPAIYYALKSCYNARKRARENELNNNYIDIVPVNRSTLEMIELHEFR